MGLEGGAEVRGEENEMAVSQRLLQVSFGAIEWSYLRGRGKQRLGCFGIHTREQFHGFTARQYATHNGLWPRVMRLIARKIERFMKSHRVLSLILWELELVGRLRHFM